MNWTEILVELSSVSSLLTRLNTICSLLPVVLPVVLVLFSANCRSNRRSLVWRSKGRSHDVKPSRVVGDRRCVAAAAERCHGNDAAAVQLRTAWLRSDVLLRPRVPVRSRGNICKCGMDKFSGKRGAEFDDIRRGSETLPDGGSSDGDRSWQ